MLGLRLKIGLPLLLLSGLIDFDIALPLLLKLVSTVDGVCASMP